MNTKHLLVLLFFGALFLSVSCKEEKKEEAKSIENQMEKVMSIHDKVMPKMGEIGRLVGKLKSKVDTTSRGITYEKAMKDLQDANTAMMNWMQDFGNRFDSDEIINGKKLTPEKKEWLNEEEEKITIVKEKINSSIEKAKSVLNQQ